MFNIFQTIFSKLLKGRQTVDDVVAKFNQAIEELKAVAADQDTQSIQHRDNAEQHRQAANQCAMLSSNAVSEAARARAVASRIEALTA